MPHRILCLLVGALASFLSVTGDVHALKFSGGCRGPGATVTTISGVNSESAKVTAKHTRADAIHYCRHRFFYEQKPRPTASELRRCADAFMREEGEKTSVYQAEANCRAGTVTLIFKVLPSTDNDPEQRLNFQLPIFSSCGSNGQQAVDVFRMLCPSYRGQIEKSP